MYVIVYSRSLFPCALSHFIFINTPIPPPQPRFFFPSIFGFWHCLSFFSGQTENWKHKNRCMKTKITAFTGVLYSNTEGHLNLTFKSSHMQNIVWTQKQSSAGGKLICFMFLPEKSQFSLSAGCGTAQSAVWSKTQYTTLSKQWNSVFGRPNRGRDPSPSIQSHVSLLRTRLKTKSPETSRKWRWLQSRSGKEDTKWPQFSAELRRSLTAKNLTPNAHPVMFLHRRD